MGLLAKIENARRRKKDVIIVAHLSYDVISNVEINPWQLREIDLLIGDEYEKKENVEEHLEVISYKIANVLTRGNRYFNVYVRTQKILTGPKSAKLLITISDDQRDPIFEL